MFFQRHYGLRCGLRAANNAVGHRLIVAADLLISTMRPMSLYEL
jgi:hypothetical protein